MSLSTNHNLEELFDLPRPADDAELDKDSATAAVTTEVSQDTLDTLAKIEEALPMVKGLEATDTEIDDLAACAKESFDNLMDLGMQVDSRYASEIFAVAGTMLGHAITAKTAKINKKLKMIDLQLKKARLDQVQSDVPSVPNGVGQVLDRNQLLRSLLARDNDIGANDK